jgi:signal transduction histidine kinase
LLDIARIRSGNLTLELERVDLAAVAREVTNRLREMFANQGCTLTLRADAPVTGMWDRMRVDQIVTNLVSNAMKYGRGRPVEVSVDGDGATARLCVRDHGIGIAEKAQVHIFERFERAASRGYGGLGLGLWIVHEIVNALGGSVRVDSRSGEGAIFTVELPCGDQPRM